MPPTERPNLTTKRLELGSLSASDAPLVNLWKNDVEVQWFSASETSSESVEDTEQRIVRWMAADPSDIIHFGIRLSPPTETSDALIGFCHIAAIETLHRRCHLGIVIGRKDLWGQGYAREACQAMVDYCFDALNMHRIGAEVYSHNPRSLALFDRLGFAREGVVRQGVWKQDAFVDEHLFGLLRHERRKGPAR